MKEFEEKSVKFIVRSSTQHYAKILDSTVSADMQMLKDKLKLFKNSIEKAM